MSAHDPMSRWNHTATIRIAPESFEYAKQFFPSVLSAESDAWERDSAAGLTREQTALFILAEVARYGAVRPDPEKYRRDCEQFYRSEFRAEGIDVPDGATFRTSPDHRRQLTIVDATWPREVDDGPRYLSEPWLISGQGDA